jgi:hypothetical protein
MDVVNFFTESQLLIIIIVSAVFIAHEVIRRDRDKWLRRMEERERKLEKERLELEERSRRQLETIDTERLELQKINAEEKGKIDRLKENIPLINSRISEHGVFFGVASLMADVETLKYAEAESIINSQDCTEAEKSNIAAELRERTKYYIQECKKTQYKYELLLKAYPGIESYIDSEVEQSCMLEHISFMDVYNWRDRAQNYLSDEEWATLSVTDRNQLALDRYVDSRRTSEWAAERDYVESCACQLMKNGYEVMIYGMEKRKEDLGRDIVAKKRGRSGGVSVLIIQCKCWKEREISEEVVMQLYSSFISYKVENSDLIIQEGARVLPVLIIPSFSRLSNVAQRYIDMLKCRLQVLDEAEYPRVKCEVNGKEKLYRLPFDKLYDRARVEVDRKSRAWSVAEAEAKGFHR